MEEALERLKKIGPDQFVNLLEKGDVLELVETNISRNFSTEDPIGFFKEHFESKVHSVLIDWFGWRTHHTQNLDDLLTLLKITYKDIAHDYKIVHKFCNRLSKVSAAEYVYYKEPHRNDQEEFRSISDQVIGTHELNFKLIIELGASRYEHELDIWDPQSPQTQVIGLLNFINHTLAQINYSKRWFLGFSYCTADQYRFIHENNLIPSIYKEAYIGLNSMMM